MIYRENPKNGDQLSQLGFGCMRFPQRGGWIDQPKTSEMVRAAIDNGVNYFDTAYIYPNSEAALGRALLDGYREKIFIATKMPLLLARSAADFDKFFEKQLSRLQTSYIDYYLMHMLIDLPHFQKYLDWGFEAWVQKEKQRGRIKNIGFSFHGRSESFQQLIDAYDWDFCMMQYNYLDENFQAGTVGLEYAHGKGLPVMVMEPLRGGTLANGLPGNARQIFDSVAPERSPAAWGLRWVWNHPEVTLLLSGMNTAEQVSENLLAADTMRPNTLTAAELHAYTSVLEIMRKSNKVGCTGCGYCLPCPVHVNIPSVFSYYNDTTVKNLGSVRFHYLNAHGIIPANPTFASQCRRCGQCLNHCPQGIPIIDALSEAAKVIEPFWVKPAAKIVKTFTVGQHSERVE